MPIRKRGESWQIDVRLGDGSRIRRSYATQEQAAEAAKALTPSPQQRATMRKLRRLTSGKSSARSNSARSSKSKSSSSPGISPLTNCVPITSQTSVEGSTHKLLPIDKPFTPS